MAIHSITIQNFKGIGPRVKTDLKLVTLLFGPNSAGKNTILDFFQESAARMESRLPDGITLYFKRWNERDGGEKFHSRYILTDLGGVTFGIGLDAGEDTQTEDVNLMSAEQYRLRWEQFAGQDDRLDLIDEPAPIFGRRNR